MKTKFNIGDFQPVDGNILVLPMQDIKIKTLIPEPIDYNPVKKGMNDSEVKKVVKKYQKEPTRVKIGKVLSIPSALQNLEYNINDYVIYLNGGMKTRLDLLASKSDDETCPILMKHYEILSKVNING